MQKSATITQMLGRTLTLLFKTMELQNIEMQNEQGITLSICLVDIEEKLRKAIYELEKLRD